MGKPQEGNQKGAQQHGEGWHGDKAFNARKEEINAHHEEREARGQRAEHDPNRDGKRSEIAREMHEQHIHEGADAGHRLMSDREQTDEAEKNSEKTRLSRDIERHDHDRHEHQIQGGATNHPGGTPTDRALNKAPHQ